ncbi:PTS sugar transporter subunit IIA [Labedella populi]|uniref:Ascorbate-specific PTS system EIIA component n=1 Tax=Labedella populi TaxID=2498850 RepID=A0A444QG05_9MICO|nr:PTS sugar transporter subunit IIA [Labedella populi]RWZ68503.1 PTS sugar transporter subunit IIA [Labedella populi]
MPLPPLTEATVRLGVSAADWRAAVRLSGDVLVASGSVSRGYPQRMVDVIEEFGAYVVIAPGLALAHARPGADVVENGLSLVTLESPVSFGHAHNDPVHVVIGIAVTTADVHVTGIADLANAFNDPDLVPALSAATDATTAIGLIESATARGAV